MIFGPEYIKIVVSFSQHFHDTWPIVMNYFTPSNRYIFPRKLQLEIVLIEDGLYAPLAYPLRKGARVQG